MSDQLSKNFTRKEFACSDGCGTNGIDLRLMPIMEIIRIHEGGKPISPTSACRCYSNNERIQIDVDENYILGSSKSRHLDCMAVDVPSKDPYKLYLFLIKLFHNTYGIGVYNWGIHIDVRPDLARWDRRTFGV